MGVNTQEFIDDMTLGLEVASQSFNGIGWASNDAQCLFATYPALVDATSGGRGDILTYGGGADLMATWSWLDRAQGNSGSNNTIHLKDLEIWIERLDNRQWQRLVGPELFSSAALWGSGGIVGFVDFNDWGIVSGDHVRVKESVIGQYAIEAWQASFMSAAARNNALIRQARRIHVRTKCRIGKYSDTGPDNRALGRFRIRQGFDIDNSTHYNYRGVGDTWNGFARPEPDYRDKAVDQGDYKKAFPGFSVDGGMSRWKRIPYSASDPDRWYFVSFTSLYPARVTAGYYGPWATERGLNDYSGEAPWGKPPFVPDITDLLQNPPPDIDATPPTVTAKKVCPMGDSLTEGADTASTPGGYRTYRGTLFTLLKQTGYAIDMVGPQQRTPYVGGDPDHAGYGGALISTGTNNLYSRLATILATPPDVGIIYIGWNDVYNNPSTIGARFESLVNEAKRLAPNTEFILCTLHPERGRTEATTNAAYAAYAELNAKVRQLAGALNTDKLTVCDFASSAGLVDADYVDSIHLLQSGADKLAALLNTAVRNTLTFGGTGGGGDTGGGTPPGGGGGGTVEPPFGPSNPNWFTHNSTTPTPAWTDWGQTGVVLPTGIVLNSGDDEMQQIKLNESTSASRRLLITCVDATDGYTAETGLSFGAGDIKISKNGGAEANHAGSFTEIGGGTYAYTFAASEVDTLGAVQVRVLKSGVRGAVFRAQVVSTDPYNAATGGLSNLDVAVSTRLPTASYENTDTLLAKAVWPGLTVLQALRGMAAMLFGKVTGAGTGREVFRSNDDGQDALTITNDTAGNRTSVSRNL